MIAILDYGCGNLRSVAKALEFLGETVEITDRAETVRAASHVILPGVGAFADAMRLLSESGLESALREAIAEGKPTLGICLGMQMLLEFSEEDGLHKGLGYFPGGVLRFPADAGKGPHMGWNRIDPNPACPLMAGLPEEAYVYFVHSYRVAGVSPDWTAAACAYGGAFSAAVWRGNLFGTQFHPEKSGDVGLILLRNFAALKPTQGRAAAC